MAKELNEDTGFTISIKSLIGIGAGMAAVISMWFVLQADIAEAKELPIPPDPEITRMEFDMKDQLVRQTIMTTQEDVTELKDRFKGRFIDYEDKRLTKIVKGYAIQAVFNSLTGDPFCEDKGCRLYNAHWQDELIFAQLESKYEFCGWHRSILDSFRRK